MIGGFALPIAIVKDCPFHALHDNITGHLKTRAGESGGEECSKAISILDPFWTRSWARTHFTV
jgi:hypothetical protein